MNTVVSRTIFCVLSDIEALIEYIFDMIIMYIYYLYRLQLIFILVCSILSQCLLFVKYMEINRIQFMKPANISYRG